MEDQKLLPERAEYSIQIDKDIDRIVFQLAAHSGTYSTDWVRSELYKLMGKKAIDLGLVTVVGFNGITTPIVNRKIDLVIIDDLIEPTKNLIDFKISARHMANALERLGEVIRASTFTVDHFKQKPSFRYKNKFTKPRK